MKFGLVCMGEIWIGVYVCNLEMVCVGAIWKRCVWVKFGNGVYGCNLEWCVWVKFGMVCMDAIWNGVYG